MKKILSATLAALLLASCGSNNSTSAVTDAPENDGGNIMQSTEQTGQPTNLTSLVAKNQLEVQPLSQSSQAPLITDFALDLTALLVEEDNVLFSPLSIMCALSMTANGAKGETLTQMETVLGADIDTLNNYLLAYKSALPNEDGYKLNLANSIWVNSANAGVINQIFLQTNVDYYDSEVYSSPFNQQLTSQVNSWVSDNTGGMIDKMMDDCNPNAVMYLINALYFDAEWQNKFTIDNIWSEDFTDYNGEVSEIDMMHSTEYGIIDIPNATGFKKYYKDNAYSFVALLPDEGQDINQFAKELDAVTLTNALQNLKQENVDITMPKFTLDYEKSLNEILIALGMENAFDGFSADFTQMTGEQGSFYIDEVLHKTIIEVDGSGTKAAAATSVAMNRMSLMPVENAKITLDRPFIYMIVDENENLPIFIGTYLFATE